MSHTQVGIVPVLSRGASLNRKDVAECLHHARLFEKTRTAGVPIGEGVPG